MALYNYSVKTAEKTGKAQAHDLDASYKDLTQILRAIKGLPVLEAYAKLDAAIKGKHAILYTKFNKGSGHRPELGGKKGRYPKKECRLVYATLKNAVANALHLGLEEKTLAITHAAAYKQNTFRRYRHFWVGSTTLGYGKHAMWADYVTSWMELFVSGKASEKKDNADVAKNEKTVDATAPRAKLLEKKKNDDNTETKNAEKPKPAKTETSKKEKQAATKKPAPNTRIEG